MSTAELPPRTVDLQIGGMTCSSCAARVQKRLNRLPGVHAEVNFATEIAHVLAPADVDVDQLVATVEATRTPDMGMWILQGQGWGLTW